MMSTPEFHRVVLEVDLGVIAENIQSYRKAVSPAQFLAVVKAFGYGTMGLTPLEPVIQTCVGHGVNRFAVSRLPEGRELRKLIPREAEILLLGSFFPAETEGLIENRITVSITSLAQWELLHATALRLNKIASAQILVDTGMGRLGIPHHEAKPQVEEILSRSRPEEGEGRGVHFTGLYSHLANAQVPDDRYTLEQIEKFAALKKWVRENFPNETEGWEFHLANSWGAGNYRESHHDLVRVGIGLYGVEPSPLHWVTLKSAVTLKSWLAAKRLLPAGHMISYDCRHRLVRDTWVGTVSAGYADGIPLGMSSPVNHRAGETDPHPQPFKGQVLIGGKRVPILGKVTMDYVMVDLNEITAEVGDEVIFFGKQGDEEITVRDFAAAKGSHGYEVLCSLPSARVARVYL